MLVLLAVVTADQVAEGAGDDSWPMYGLEYIENHAFGHIGEEVEWVPVS